MFLAGCVDRQQAAAAREEAVNAQLDLLLGSDSVVWFSVYEKTFWGQRLAALDSVAVEGRIRVKQRHDPFWGEGSDYLSDVLQDPTWLMICRTAHEMIETVGDRHHRFLEGYEFIGAQTDGVLIIEL